MMSTFVFKCARKGEVRFNTFSPERTTRGGEVARKPIPIRTLTFAKRIRNENPANQTLITQENIEISGLISLQLGLGIQVVEERVDQIRIGLDLPLEVFRGRLNYILNGHHRAVASYMAKTEDCSAYVINTQERTLIEEEWFDPLSEKVLASPSIWQLAKYQYPFLEPREERVESFIKKLGPLGRNLGAKMEQVPTVAATRGLRDGIIKLLAFEDFDETVSSIEQKFGLNISDLQLVCLMRDALRQKWLYDRLRRINSTDPDKRLQKKIEGMKRLGALSGQLIELHSR